MSVEMRAARCDLRFVPRASGASTFVGSLGVLVGHCHGTGLQKIHVDSKSRRLEVASLSQSFLCQVQSRVCD